MVTNMMKKSVFLTCLVLCVVLMASCVKRLKEIRVVSEKPGHTLLIAGNSSAFKDKVRQRIIEKYKQTCTIHVVNVKALDERLAADYDVVLIMDTCVAWSVSSNSLKTFMDREQNRQKTVFAMTAGKSDWSYSYKGVDAITSASRVENEEVFFNRIDTGIERILAKAE